MLNESLSGPANQKRDTDFPKHLPSVTGSLSRCLYYIKSSAENHSERSNPLNQGAGGVSPLVQADSVALLVISAKTNAAAAQGKVLFDIT